MDFATIDDVNVLFRPLTDAEKARVEFLIPLICDCLRIEAKKVGKDMDAMAESDPDYASVCKLVTVDVVSRVLRQSNTGEPVTQATQSALGYSQSYTYAVPGGGSANAIMRNDLKRLGLYRQKVGVFDPYA